MSRVATSSEAAAPAASPTAATTIDNRVEQQRALQQYIANHPEMRRVRQDAARARWKATNGPYVRTLGLTPQQVDQAAEVYGRNFDSRAVQSAAGQTPFLDSNMSQFRAMFGEAAADRWANNAASGMRWATQVVNELGTDYFYADASFTLEQVDQLAALIMTHYDRSARSPAGNRLEAVDWDKVMREAEPMLSRAQRQGLAALAARGRNQALMAMAEKEMSAKPSK